jgi:hypothetical protein
MVGYFPVLSNRKAVMPPFFVFLECPRIELEWAETEVDFSSNFLFLFVFC